MQLLSSSKYCNNLVTMITVYNHHTFRPQNKLFAWKICIKLYCVFTHSYPALLLNKEAFVACSKLTFNFYCVIQSKGE